MKQYIFYASLCLWAALLTACSSETTEQTPSHAAVTVDAGSIKFSISEAPFGVDLHLGSRSVNDRSTQKVDLGEDVEAELSIEQDAAPAITRAARPMSDGNYTIVAYRNGVRMPQQVTFTVSGGVLHLTSAQKRYRWMTPGSVYTFVCFNDKVRDKGDGTFAIALEDAPSALIDKQDVTIGTADPVIAFTMKRAAARVRTKLITLIDPNASLNMKLGYRANTVPASKIYNLATGEFTTSAQKNILNHAVTQNYVATESIYDTKIDDDLSTATSTTYLYVLAGTKSEELDYQIIGGTLYNKVLSPSAVRKMKASGVFAANGSYTLTIKLMPKYKYLFEDGVQGFLKDTGRSAHTPIAVVFAPGKAIALWNAGGGSRMRWDEEIYNANAKRNSTNFNTIAAILNSAIRGNVWTWEKNYNGKAKTEVAKFPAYRAAGYFYQSADLKSKIPSGRNLAANLNKTEVWYLPSCSEWKEAFVNLGFAESSDFTGIVTTGWRGRWVNYAFRIADGQSIANRAFTRYWTSSEYLLEDACMVATDRSTVSIGHAHKYFNNPFVRPFVLF